MFLGQKGVMEHEDYFCPECGANVGPGTLETIGCPLCGYDELVDYDDEGFEDDDD